MAGGIFDAHTSAIVAALAAPTHLGTSTRMFPAGRVMRYEAAEKLFSECQPQWYTFGQPGTGFGKPNCAALSSSLSSLSL